MFDLTIIMPCYNKEAYIKEALDSVFAQKTKYTYQVLIADDCSTDGTLQIVESYLGKHPQKINILRSEKNLKLFGNVVRAYALIKTPYFCVLDPDDYWTADNHIEKAISFLENNKEYALYTANFSYLDEFGNVRESGFPLEERKSSLKDYFQGRSVIAYTQTAVYRNVVFKEGLPDFQRRGLLPSYQRAFRGDTFRNLVHLEKGLAYYDPSVDAIYRLTSDGIWAGASVFSHEVLSCQIYANLFLFFEKKYIGFFDKFLSLYSIFQKKRHEILEEREALAELDDFYGLNIGCVWRVKVWRISHLFSIRQICNSYVYIRKNGIRNFISYCFSRVLNGF